MIAILNRAKREVTEFGHVLPSTRYDLDRMGVSSVTLEQFLSL